MINPQLEISFQDIAATSYLLRDQIINTQCVLSRLTEHFRCKGLYLKLEHKQNGGSYKSRGAFNVLLNLSSEDQRRGVVTASQGNHGVALSHAGKVLGVPVTIVFPRLSPTSKIQVCRKNQAEFFVDGADIRESLAIAATIAKKANKKFIDIFTNFAIGVGNATVGLEIAQQVPMMDYCIIPITSEKGILRGMQLAIKKLCPRCKIYAVQGPSKHQSRLTTTSDPFVDRVIEVSDDDILTAFLLLIEVEKVLVEPTSAMALAAITSKKYPEFMGKNVALLLGNGNVDLAAVSNMLQKSNDVPANKMSFAVSIPDEIGALQMLCETITKQQVSIRDIVFPRSVNEPMIVFCEMKGPEHSKIFIRNMLAVYPDFQVIPAKTRGAKERNFEVQPFYMQHKEGHLSDHQKSGEVEYQNERNEDPSQMEFPPDHVQSGMSSLSLVQQNARFPYGSNKVENRPYVINNEIRNKPRFEKHTQTSSYPIQNGQSGCEPQVLERKPYENVYGNPRTPNNSTMVYDHEEAPISVVEQRSRRGFSDKRVGTSRHRNPNRIVGQYTELGNNQRYTFGAYTQDRDRMERVHVDEKQHLYTRLGQIDTGETISVGRVDEHKRTTRISLIEGKRIIAPGNTSEQKHKRVDRSSEDEECSRYDTSQRSCGYGHNKNLDESSYDSQYEEPHSRSTLQHSDSRRDYLYRLLSPLDRENTRSFHRARRDRRKMSASSTAQDHQKQSRKSLSNTRDNSNSRQNLERDDTSQFQTFTPDTCSFYSRKPSDQRKDRYCECGLKISGCTRNTCAAFKTLSKDSQKSTESKKSQKSLKSTRLKRAQTKSGEGIVSLSSTCNTTSSCTTSTESSDKVEPVGPLSSINADVKSNTTTHEKSSRLDAGADKFQFEPHALKYEECHCSKSLVCNYCDFPLHFNLSLNDTCALNFSETIYDFNFEAGLSDTIRF